VPPSLAWTVTIEIAGRQPFIDEVGILQQPMRPPAGRSVRQFLSGLRLL
jgi:hypothetical protein